MIGNILRCSNLAQLIIEEITDGKTARGRLKYTFIEQTVKTVNFPTSNRKVKEPAQNRARWDYVK